MLVADAGGGSLAHALISGWFSHRRAAGRSAVEEADRPARTDRARIGGGDVTPGQSGNAVPGPMAGQHKQGHRND